MKRLTLKTPTGAALALNNPRTEVEAREQLMAAYKVAMDKLSAYEDTFLEPSEIEELISKLNRCRELLRMAVNELEERMSDLCETTEIDSVYSPCHICVNQKKCKGDVVSGLEWIHTREVMEVLKC